MKWYFTSQEWWTFCAKIFVGCCLCQCIVLGLLRIRKLRMDEKNWGSGRKDEEEMMMDKPEDEKKDEEAPAMDEMMAEM